MCVWLPNVYFQLRAVGEVVYILFLAFYLQKEVRRMLHYRPPLAYFMKFGNLFEVLLLSLMFALVIFWARFVTDPLRVFYWRTLASMCAPSVFYMCHCCTVDSLRV